jgi:hypothetical protein
VVRLMLRRVLAAAFVAAILMSGVPLASARDSLPPCCKTHGCTMMKRAAHGCAFSRCDQSNDSTTASRQVIAVLTVEPVSMSHRVLLPLDREDSPSTQLESANNIDHPPERPFV